MGGTQSAGSADWGKLSCSRPSGGLCARWNGSTGFDGFDDGGTGPSCGGEADCGLHTWAGASGVGVGATEGGGDGDLSGGRCAGDCGDGLWDGDDSSGGKDLWSRERVGGGGEEAGFWESRN